MISPTLFGTHRLLPISRSSQKKQLVLALAKAHLGETSDHTFDDFVVGKGRGLIMLLQ